MLVTPGLQFFAEPMSTAQPGRLEPTMSTYGIADLEGSPQRGELYVICQDGSVQSVYQPGRPIGWQLLEDENGFYWRVTQVNHRPKPCMVGFHSRVADPPVGGRQVGSVVTFERRIDSPQDAEMTEAVDNDVEVCSRVFGPNMATALSMVNDPDQTYAMAQFARGEMSYAEMRMRCG